MPTDTDASVAVDGSEELFVPRVTVTGTAVTDAAGSPAQGLVEFDAGQLHVSPGTGGAAGVWDQFAMSQIAGGVMTSLQLPDSNLAFASSFTYTVTLKIEGVDDYQVTGVVLSRTQYPSGTVDLSEIA